MALEVGAKAPDFTLPASDGENVGKVTLSETLGNDNVVLAFFPLAFTSVCREEMCEFRDQLGQFNEMNAKVYGISVDSPFSLNEFSKSEALNFELLSDFNKEVSSKYGVLYEQLADFKGVSKRSVFVIDQRGTVKYSWVTEDPTNKPDLGEISQALQGLG